MVVKFNIMASYAYYGTQPSQPLSAYKKSSEASTPMLSNSSLNEDQIVPPRPEIRFPARAMVDLTSEGSDQKPSVLHA